MKISTAAFLFSLLSLCATTTTTTTVDAFAPQSPLAFRGGELYSTKEKTEGKKIGKDAPPVNIGWDTHQAIVSSTKTTNNKQNNVVKNCFSKKAIQYGIHKEDKTNCYNQICLLFNFGSQNYVLLPFKYTRIII